MQPKTRKLILSIIAVLVIITGTVIYLAWNKPHKNVEDSPAVEITAADLYAIFITDSTKANLLYTGKVLNVSGEVEKISLNQQSQQVIFLKTRLAGAFINCTMEKKNVDCKTGAQITIKGICSGDISGDADMGLPGDVFLIRGY